MSQTLTIPEVHQDIPQRALPSKRRRLRGRARPSRGALAVAALVLLVGLSLVTVALSGVREPLLLPERLGATNPYTPAPSVGPTRLGGTNAHLDGSRSEPAGPRVPTGIVTHR